MRIKKSEQMNGWIGFFTEGEDGRQEETLSVKDIEKAQQIIDQLQKDLIRLRPKTKTKEARK